MVCIVDGNEKKPGCCCEVAVSRDSTVNLISYQPHSWQTQPRVHFQLLTKDRSVHVELRLGLILCHRGERTCTFQLCPFLLL